jgi:hypothetical protein
LKEQLNAQHHAQENIALNDVENPQATTTLDPASATAPVEAEAEKEKEKKPKKERQVKKKKN